MKNRTHYPKTGYSPKNRDKPYKYDDPTAIEKRKMREEEALEKERLKNIEPVED